jgi:hypothetical protein
MDDKEMTIILDGERVCGTALKIVNRMAGWVMTRTFNNADEYIAWEASILWRTEKTGIQISGTTPEDRAASLLNELARIGKIKIEAE